MTFYGTEHPEPVDVDPFAPDDGAALLDEVDAMLSTFVAFPSIETRHAVALWVAHTHVVDAFETTPRLAFLSPEPGSGKTRALEIVEMLVPAPLLTTNATPAYLIRKLADEVRPTLLFDEIDTVFGPRAKSDNEDVRGLLNSGYRRGATSGRCVVKGKSVETEEFPSFAAVALAGLDDLPDTVMTRAVVVRMRRRAPHETVRPYRRRVHESAGHELRDRLAAWARGRYVDLQDAWPALPHGVEDRDADVWEPLIAVADAAGGTWPERARVSAVSLVSLAAQERGGLGVTLLSDLRTVFGDADHMGTDEILNALHELDESPWADLKGKPLDARGLSWRLGKYEVRPRQVKALNRKGYQRADLADAWSRYLPPVSVVSLVSDAQGNREGAADDLEPPPLVSDGFGSMGEPIPSRTRETGLSLPSRGSETAETSETAAGCPLHPEPRPATCWTCETEAAS